MILNSPSLLIAPNLKLEGRYPYEGYVTVRDGSIWRLVINKLWDEYQQKLLCEHLGFTSTEQSARSDQCPKGSKIASGDLICYYTKAHRISCCVHLYPSIANGHERRLHAQCK